MTCLCKNQDGSFSSVCFGTCTQREVHLQDAVTERSEKSIKDWVEYALEIFMDKIDDRIKKLESISMENWTDGYRQGYEDGKNS